MNFHLHTEHPQPHANEQGSGTWGLFICKQTHIWILTACPCTWKYVQLFLVHGKQWLYRAPHRRGLMILENMDRQKSISNKCFSGKCRSHTLLIICDHIPIVFLCMKLPLCALCPENSTWHTGGIFLSLTLWASASVLGENAVKVPQLSFTSGLNQKPQRCVCCYGNPHPNLYWKCFFSPLQWYNKIMPVLNSTVWNVLFQFQWSTS